MTLNFRDLVGFDTSMKQMWESPIYAPGRSGRFSPGTRFWHSFDSIYVCELFLKGLFCRPAKNENKYLNDDDSNNNDSNINNNKMKQTSIKLKWICLKCKDEETTDH